MRGALLTAHARQQLTMGVKAAGQEDGFFNHTSSCMVNVTRALHPMHFMLQVDSLLTIGVLMELSCSSTKK